MKKLALMGADSSSTCSEAAKILAKQEGVTMNLQSERISGRAAVLVLESLSDVCSLHRKDNTDKIWSYKINTGRRTEFAFDPNTKTKLGIWFDTKPPTMPGVERVQEISGKSSSTALDRVLSGGIHTARWKAEIRDEATLRALLNQLK